MSSPISPPCGIEFDRRALLAGVALLIAVRPARAEPEDLRRALLAYTDGVEARPGKVHLDLPPLVENGNAVSLEVSVDHPVTGDNPVREIAIFTEKNPQPDVAIVRFTPRSGRAFLGTRMRLATSQHVTAVARFADGSFHAETREVIVTIAACTEE